VRAHPFLILLAFIASAFVACAPRSKRFYVKPDTGTYTSDNLQAAEAIGMLNAGVVPVKLEVLD
jgi:hypothetical protein